MIIRLCHIAPANCFPLLCQFLSCASCILFCYSPCCLCSRSRFTCVSLSHLPVCLSSLSRPPSVPDRQENFKSSMGAQFTLVVDQVQKPQSPPVPPPSSAAASPPTLTVPLSPPVPLHLSKPAVFSGDSGDCTAFLTQCQLHFKLQAAAFPADQARVAYIISHLGLAEALATAEWSCSSAICNSLALFTRSFTQIL